MTDLGWIEIPNWDRFQHYRDRDPPWIKFYTELLHDPDYLALSGDQRAILHGLWLRVRVEPTPTPRRDTLALFSTTPQSH